MKKLLLAVIALGSGMFCLAQEDSTKEERKDTIHIGGMVIIKDRDNGDVHGNGHGNIYISNHRRRKSPNLQTNWAILDIGFANFNDQTNYASAEAQAFAPGFTSKEAMNVRTGKSVNVNFWFFMQKLNVVKHVVNLKYGLGLELNNYHFDDEKVRLTKNPTIVTIDPALENIDKNKLAADYITVPMMLNFNFTPRLKRGFGLSVGASAGYLYSSRQKFKGNDDKDKVHDDFTLNKWKLSYIGELNLGPVVLYGTYGMESMWDKGLDQTPYTVGIRISHM
jgi:hypothetical protein